MWNEAAQRAGNAYGMCQECFDEHYVSVNLEYEPKTVVYQMISVRGEVGEFIYRPSHYPGPIAMNATIEPHRALIQVHLPEKKNDENIV